MASRYPYTGFVTRPSRLAAGELRIVMVGRTGAGKSATGNTILGRDCFESVLSATSMTNECAKGKGTVEGQKVAVIDTPGLFDTRHDPETTCWNITQCMSYASPGPHVFLVVIRLDRFTEEEKQTVQQIQDMFGEAADRYSMVLFTRGDDLIGTTIEKFMEGSVDLKHLVARCNGQYHVFNNRLQDRRQVVELLEKIRNIVRNNGEKHYTSEMFQEAERAIRAKQQDILRGKQEEIRQETMKLETRVRAEYDAKLKSLTEQYQAEREEGRKEREREKQEMQVMWNDMKREGERFVKEKVEMELARNKERHSMELMRVREGQQMEQVQHMMMAMNGLCQQLQMVMQQFNEGKQQLALGWQKVEMEKECMQRRENDWRDIQQREEMRRAAERQEDMRREMERREDMRREMERREGMVREMERLKWENEKKDLLRAQCERELEEEKKKLQNKYQEDARKEAEDENPVWGLAKKAWGGIKNVGRGFLNLFK